MTAHEQWLPSASDQEDALARYDNDGGDPIDPTEDRVHLAHAFELLPRGQGHGVTAMGPVVTLHCSLDSGG